MLNDAGRNHLLPGCRQFLHQRTHQIKMRLAPQGNLMKTGHRIGVLPQIQMERPFCGFRQLPLADLQREWKT